MFGLMKFLFYTFVAVVVGVFIGTVPIGGRTIAERIVEVYKSPPAEADNLMKMLKEQSRGGNPAGKASSKKVPAVTSAGAANSPDRQTPEDKVAVDRLIAARAGRGQ